MAEKHFVPVANILPPIQCNWSVGVFLERFYQDLGEKKFTGIKCMHCQKVYLPPRKYCWKCGVEMKKFVSVKPVGELVNFTLAHQKLNGSPREAPIVIGLVRLGNADTAIFGELREVDPAELRTGLRVKAVFADEPAQTVGSLSHFVPAKKK